MVKNFSNSHFQLGHVFNLVFFLIGLSAGISFSLYFKSIFFKLQNAAISNSSLKSPTQLVVPSQPPLLAPPPPPKHKPILLHYMDDDEVFSRALESPPRIRGTPPKHVPKVAFMFLTKGPMPLVPLWEMFFKGHEELYTIYVHPHPLFVDSILENSVFYRRRIPSQVKFLFLCPVYLCYICHIIFLITTR